MIKPMLAATLKDEDMIPYPVLASPKIDGIRALVFDGCIFSRNWKLIPNKFIQESVDWDRYNGLDGELVVGDPSNSEVFRTTSSGVRSVSGEPDFSFIVFDNFLDINKGYADRIDGVFDHIDQNSRIEIINNTPIMNEEELLNHEEKFLVQGFEGAMLRDPNGLYKNGRSTINEFGLVKVKRFLDGEAKIIGYEELMTNVNDKTLSSGGKAKRNSKKEGLLRAGVLGAFVVRDIVTGVKFNIGSGFTDEERSRFWMLSVESPHSLEECVVKYRYFSVGESGSPRFPTFQGFRYD